MKNRKLFITILIILSFTILGVAGVAGIASVEATESVRPLEKMAAMDLTHENFVGNKADVETGLPAGGSETTLPAGVGDTEIVSVSDDYKGTVYDEEFIVVEEGDNCLILIPKAASDTFDGVTYYFLNEFGTWGFYNHTITAEQLTYMKDEFDNNMYPTLTPIYGIPDLRPDNSSDEDAHKIWILIFNIKDFAYYNETAEWYVAGYFSGSTSAQEDKNIIHIDTYNWEDRVGSGVERPYLYEGTIAHEFEHLIHSDIDPNEPSWVDEGLADLAGYFCGYGHSAGHIANYLVNHPYTSLTFWGSGLEDYGASYLFAFYLYEQFGKAAFITDLVKEQANGIEGIQKTLDNWSYGVTFDEVYDAWTIAVYFDDPELGSIYGFDDLEIGSEEDTWGYSINWAITHMHFTANPKQNPFNAPISFDSPFGTVMPYTTHYYPFGASTPTVDAYLEGDILAGPGPYGGSGWSWYSKVDAWAWRSFYQTFDLTDYTNVNLDFYTYFEIEDDWDYGYVEVYDKTNDAWVTLEDPSFMMDVYNTETQLYDSVPMRDFVAIPQDNPNTPEEQEPTTYEITGDFHAFTGFSNGWVPVHMDLSDFAGCEIELHFRTWQDAAFTYQMMYVDNILITADNNVLCNDIIPDNETTPWDTTPDYEGGDSWSIFEGYEENNWQATYIETFKEPQKSASGLRIEPIHKRELIGPIYMDMYVGQSWIYPTTNVQWGIITGLDASPSRNEHSMVLIVSNRADHILPAWYHLWFEEGILPVIN